VVWEIIALDLLDMIEIKLILQIWGMISIKVMMEEWAAPHLMLHQVTEMLN